MSTKPIEVHGTLQQDGTLVLDDKPNLPPGRVKVTVAPVREYKQTEIWQFFERLWAEQRARGHVSRHGRRSMPSWSRLASLFLTTDTRWSSFPDRAVEVLS